MSVSTTPPISLPAKPPDSIPVQVIWRAEDEILPVHHAEALPPNLRTHVLPDAGHMPQMEKAAEVNRLIAELVAL